MRSFDSYEVLLIKQATRKDVVNAFQIDNWIIWDEIQRSAAQPYEIVWAADDEGQTLVSYIQDTVVQMDYLVVRGAAVGAVAQAVRLLFGERLVGRDAPFAQWGQARSRAEKIHALYQVGAGAGSGYEPQAYATLCAAAEDADAVVRRAAVWAMSYIAWPAVRALAARCAAQDADAEVRTLAATLQRAYALGAGMGFSPPQPDAADSSALPGSAGL